MTAAKRRCRALHFKRLDREPPVEDAMRLVRLLAFGLLIACAPDRAEAILGRIVMAGYPCSHIIGHADSGTPAVTIR